MTPAEEATTKTNGRGTQLNPARKKEKRLLDTFFSRFGISLPGVHFAETFLVGPPCDSLVFKALYFSTSLMLAETSTEAPGYFFCDFRISVPGVHFAETILL